MLPHLISSPTNGAGTYSLQIVKLNKHQICVVERFLGADVDLLKKGLVKLLLIALESNEEVQLIFSKGLFDLFDQLLNLLDILRVTIKED